MFDYKTEIKDVHQLEAYIIQCNEAYYNGEPVIDDIKYDELYDTLKTLNQIVFGSFFWTVSFRIPFGFLSEL